MKIISFKLTMPNVGSWNGKWSLAEKLFYIILKFSNEDAEKIMSGAKPDIIYEGVFVRKKIGETLPRKRWHYSFGDGWGASIIAEIIDNKEANKRRKISSGFCGYDWMVRSIIKFGEIKTYQEVKQCQNG